MSPPLDHLGRPISPGALVRIRSVASCVSELPEEDIARRTSLVARQRTVSEIDRFGFVWLSFDAGVTRSDFCLMPTEVEVG